MGFVRWAAVVGARGLGALEINCNVEVEKKIQEIRDEGLRGVRVVVGIAEGQL
jgi:CTP:phosphocholine cytidylyltransferase-like protein